MLSIEWSSLSSFPASDTTRSHCMLSSREPVACSQVNLVLTQKFQGRQPIDPTRWQGKLHRSRYWNEYYFNALNDIREPAEKHGLTFTECALRSMMPHSQSKGGSIMTLLSSSQVVPSSFESNLVDLKKGPLPEDVVNILDDGWPLVKGFQGKYWH